MTSILQLDDEQGASINGISVEILFAIMVVQSHFAQVGAKYCIITSAKDGVHGKNSLHYTGDAVDFRTRTLDAATVEAIAEAVREALGRHYDVVVEPTHLHVEFQPRSV